MNKRQKLNINNSHVDDLKYFKSLGKKYDVDLGSKIPIVSVKRLKFNASHYGADGKKRPYAEILNQSSVMYNILGQIISFLEIKDRYSASACCRLWNRAVKENIVWKSIIMKNKSIIDLGTLQRKVLKYETEYLHLENVSISSSACVQDFCRFNTISTLICYETDINLIKRTLRACNQLRYFKSNTHDDSILEDINPYIKILDLENIAINHQNTKVIKNFTDLETLLIKTIEPYCYKSISLFFSIKNLKVLTLLINNEIQNVFECIPNIEFLEFTPILEQNESSILVVEALKRCPSLKKLHWVIETTPKYIKLNYDTDVNNSTNDVQNSILKENGITCNDTSSIGPLKNIALKQYLTTSLQECEILIT